VRERRCCCRQIESKQAPIYRHKNVLPYTVRLLPHELHIHLCFLPRRVYFLKPEQQQALCFPLMNDEVIAFHEQANHTS